MLLVRAKSHASTIEPFTTPFINRCDTFQVSSGMSIEKIFNISSKTSFWKNIFSQQNQTHPYPFHVRQKLHTPPLSTTFRIKTNNGRQKFLQFSPQKKVHRLITFFKQTLLAFFEKRRGSRDCLLLLYDILTNTKQNSNAWSSLLQ